MIADFAARIAAERREYAIHCLEHAAEMLEAAVAVVMVDVAGPPWPESANPADRVRAAAQVAADALGALSLLAIGRPE
jgi:hypothetical protein